MASKKILIFHLSRLGDMIQSLPAVKCLKEDQPGSEITFFGIEDFCIPLKGVPWIDRLETIPSRDLKVFKTESTDIDTGAFERMFQEYPALREHYDLLVNLTHSRGSGYLCDRISASEKTGRIFSRAGETAVAGNWAKYLFAVARNRNDNLLNLVDLYMGMAGVTNRPVSGYLPTNPEADRRCHSHMKELGIRTDRPAVGFQLGASNALRTWPPEHFFRLGSVLAEKMNAQVILFGSEKERELADSFRRSATFPCVDLMGKTTLQDLPSYLRQIDVLVSNDTGPMHIAAAVGTRVVGIFAGTAYFRITGPYGSGHIAVQSDYPCAPCLNSTSCVRPLCGKGISPEAVLRGVQCALGLEDSASGTVAGASLYRSDFGRHGTMHHTRLDGENGHFSAWLRSFHDTKASVSQSLWNSWLGMESHHDGVVHGRERNGELAGFVQEYQVACLSYRKLYSRGAKACREIISEFRKPRPVLSTIRGRIARIEEVEREIVALESPLGILKEIHEFYSAETGCCDFPQLAHEFLTKYSTLNQMIDGFEGRLKQLDSGIRFTR